MARNRDRLRTILAVAAMTACAACGEYPRDVEGTTERLDQGYPLRLGVVAGATITPEAQSALTRLSSQLGAPIERHVAPAEIDLVIGPFAKQSPMRKNASLSRTIAAPEPRSGKTPALRFARKNGENRWILLTDRVASP